ncbi:ABC transporter permease subunit [Candidatus Thioglobus sp.]|jgi:Cu-processing system permease protein|uniref:ABC transporter permease n=1 Tax=Candidatus Thioglobus sp. TaxID=2026721 RepID=UPI001E021CD9|nr:ABC transporter permease subunit [Candidatus Thioglobus sp.]MBT3276498.1 ABC transporter permease subunit [Candidatus Thioglobus sp.]MBT3446447.1 ABC transporter permease subunit [Candidatus Thioglobus sp.]MBT4001270.1 ABC transporter permease subunit [Candidatus Thioglobus sp.]MBT4181751.1 ABC transporter permease subunit [Candidatus Thioglobus sp.]MBT6022047.1 ABC transporter permease subunit [Candidatus Thioglobus sp.]
MFSPILIISLREVKNALENHYLFGMILLLATLSLSLILLGDTPVGSTGVSQLSTQITSLSSLSIFFIPLMALFISYDSIVGESEQGSLLLMLSYPIKRYQFLLGKFFANWISLSIAIIFGYSAILLLSLFNNTLTAEFIQIYLRFVFTSILLGGIFTSIGYLISVVVAQRSTAIIYCMSAWLFFVVFFDMILLIIITSKYSYLISADLLGNILLLNPIDIFRIISIGEQGNNLLPLQAISNVVTLPGYTLLLSMITWAVLPLLIAINLFKKKAL